MDHITKKIIQTKKNIFLTFFFAVAVLLLPVSVTQEGSMNSVYRTDTIHNSIHFSLETNTVSAQSTTDVIKHEKEGSGSEIFEKGVRALIDIIGNFLLFLGAIVLWAGGVVFEGAVKYLIVDFKDFSPLRVINDVWTVVRDVCNLVFIFGFIYLGIKTIFDPDSAQTKRFLTKIIIGALLINFSLFFTKVVIDITNFTAVTIYNEGTAAMDGATIPGVIMTILGMSSIFGGVNADTLNATLGGLFGYYIMAFIFLIICGIVFFFVAIQLVTRFVTLIFVMIASPVLFAGAIFPKTEEYSSKLWNTLIAHSLYPVVFLFLAFISLKILDFTSKTILSNNKGDLKDTFTQNNPIEFAEVALLFFISMVIFYQAHVIAKKISESGGTLSVNGIRDRVGKMAGRTAGAASGLTARGLRVTAGQRAHKRLNDENLKARVALEGKEGDKARAQLMRAQKMASATYDVRNIKIGGKSAGDRLGAGAGIKDGYKQQVDARMKAEQEFAKNLGYDKNAEKLAEKMSDTKIREAEENVATIKNELKEETRADREKLREVTRHAHEVSAALRHATQNLMLAETNEDRDAIQATINSLTEQKEAHVNEINALNTSIQNTTEGYQERITQAESAVATAQAEKPKNIEKAIEKAKGVRQTAYAGVVASGKGVTSRIATGQSIPILSRYTNTKHSNTVVADALKKTAGKDKTPVENLAEQISKMQKN